MKKEAIALWSLPIDHVFLKLKTSRKGLSANEAQQRLSNAGTNMLLQKNTKHWLDILISQFKDPLAGVLVFAAIISMFLNDTISAIVIISIILINAIIGFYQEYKAEKTVEELEKYVKIKTKVLRDGKFIELDADELVPGDVIKLSIGDIIPADIRLFETEEMTTDEAALTGESVPVTKKINIVSENHSLPQYLHNMAFTGTSVSAGSGMGVVTAIGKDTFFGKTAALVGKREVETQFHRAMKDFGKLSLRIVLFMTVFIFAANTILGKDPFYSFLFALAIAVGITPEMLPIIITITLSHGALKMAKDKVIVKNLEAVEDLGNIDVLCCDKTGTLTEGAISLEGYIDTQGKKQDKLLLYALLCNSAKENEAHNPSVSPIDRAIWESKEADGLKTHLTSYKYIDENTFDFERKRMSVIVQKNGKKTLIAKGAYENILSVSSYIKIGGYLESLTIKKKAKMLDMIQQKEEKGYRVIAIAEKATSKSETNGSDESGMTLLGFLLFFDPPKESTKETLAQMQGMGIKIKIMTGDSPTITRKTCNAVGLTIEENRIITGDEIMKMKPDELHVVCDKYNVFARVTPEQKYIIVTKLQELGHEVGFLGDGINDAPALRAATVGITVDSAAGIAKESADIILLNKGLNVIAEGIKQGRKTFGNITKYIMNTISANYGNMITVALSSLMLPFIPLNPSQILLNNFLSDIPLLTVPTDKVDKDLLKKPKKWNIKMIERFMIVFGLISTVFDLILIFILFFVFQVDPALFRTAWFVESSLSEIIVTFSIRTKMPFFKSMPSKMLLWSSLLTSLAALSITYLAIGGTLFEFVFMPWHIVVLILIILILYFATAEIAKQIFFKKYDI